MENLNDSKERARALRLVNIMNGSAVAFMLLLCLDRSGGGGVFAFLIGGAFAIVNLILLIMYARKGYNAYIFCIIWMLLMPIIGFGCCASALSGTNF